MRRSVPWQELVAVMFLYVLIYVVLTLAAVACIWVRAPYLSAILLFAAFAALAFLGPISLSWTRDSYKVLLPLHLGHQAVAVFVYAGHYARAELAALDGSLSSRYTDALYYSLAMWTTLGTSDFAVPRELRLLTTLEALTAVLFVPVFAAVFWQLLQEATTPPDEAFLDRKRGRGPPREGTQ